MDSECKSELYHMINLRQKERNSVFRTLEVQLEKNSEKWKGIILMSFNELSGSLVSEALSPLDVLHAYQWQALKAQTQTNCITIFFEEADSIAKRIEADYKGKTPKPLLYGIPCSVKENFQVRGHDSTVGYSSRLFQPCTEDAVLVKALRNLGAIPFAQTNNPQGVDTFSCSNPIYGRTANPVHPARTCGGSTGGEAALIALNGSPFGIGGDLGGSIRLPAHFSGIAGLKPTAARVSRRGTIPGKPGLVYPSSGVGPMAANMETLVSVWKALWSPESRLFTMDAYSVPLGFQHDLFNGKKQLTIGYFESNELFEAVPACKRAVREAKQILEKAGHTLIHWDVPDMKHASELVWASFNADGGSNSRQMTDCDIIDTQRETVLKRDIPRSAKATHQYAVETSSDINKVFSAIHTYRQNFLEQWETSGLDGLICPACAVPAVPDFVAILPETIDAFCYTYVFNLVDFPAGVLPFTKVDPEDEDGMAGFPETSPGCKLMKECCSTGTVGLPVGLQCVARPFQDELALKIMAVVEQSLQKK